MGALRTSDTAGRPHASALPGWHAAAAATFAVLWSGLLLWLGHRRFVSYNAGMYDLGNMAQAIDSVLRGQPLVVTFPEGPLSRLAMHVELFYYLLAPLWALWPDPRALLAAQAALYAAGALPAYRLGARAADSALGGLCLALLYLLYPVAQTAVLFDLHGDTLAMPLLLFALEALDRRAWRAYAVWLALALSCKFYVAVPVAALGLILIPRPATRLPGLLTFGAATLYGLLAFFAIRPLFTTATTASSHRGLNYLGTYFGQFDQLAATAVERLLTAAIVLGPAMLLAWGGRRWLLPALPVALAALVSTGPGGSFDYRYHHYATVVPFVVMAAAAGLRRAREREGRPGARPWRSDLIFTTLVVALLTVALVDQPLNPLFWAGAPATGIDSSAYGSLSRDAVKSGFLERYVPPRAPLAASPFLATHLVRRETLYLTRYADDPGGERLPALLPEVDYALADALFDWRAVEGELVLGGAAYERAEIGLLLRDPAFGLVAADDGLLLFQRGAPAPLAQEATLAPDPGAAPVAEVGPAQLLAYSLEPLGGRRFKAAFTWRLAGEVPPRGLVAVSRLEGLPDARVVHLPTYALRPIGSWPPGQVVEERFELEIPARVPAGTYGWRVGWYSLGHPEAYATDARSLAGPEVTLGAVTVP
ncbi:MAG TPA: DUF2079 domain-containing protein [Chloroflexaceae bacterium]|nr:DUF2079 domain-containing protein [Chloroflexaceae bacterium]